MAYNRLNKLHQIKKIVDVYLLEKKEGMTVDYVYRKHIYPQFRISKRAFYSCLQMPVAKMIREEEARMEQQSKDSGSNPSFF